MSDQTSTSGPHGGATRERDMIQESRPGPVVPEETIIRQVAPVAAGESVAIPVEPGTILHLESAEFAPSAANYEVVGEDLVVTLTGGGIVVLEKFFVEHDPAIWLRLPNDTTIAATDIIAGQQTSAAIDLGQIEPAAGDADGASQSGGGANFTPFDDGSLPPSLDPLGPQPPVELSFADVASLDLEGTRADAGANTDASRSSGDAGTGGPGDTQSPPSSPPEVVFPPPPPEAPPNEAPTVSVSASVDGTIGDSPVGMAFTSAMPLPIRGERKSIATDKINNVDQGNLTIPEAVTGSDGIREIQVSFDGSTNSGFGNTLGYYTIGVDGTLLNPTIIFGNENRVAPGETVSLGTFEPGTELGFFIIARGGDINPDSLFETGSLSFVNPNSGDPAKISDFAVPRLVHIDLGGDETIIRGTIYHTADESGGTPNHNRLNPDNLSHAVSGFDAKSGAFVIGMEDQNNQGDRDFDDVVFRVSIGDAERQTILYADNQGSLEVAISDVDSTSVNAASVNIVDGARAGDRLDVAGFDIDPSTGLISGTGIQVTGVGTTSLAFSGNDDIETYTDVLNAIRLGSSSGTLEEGSRSLAVDVTDDQGATSTLQTADIVIQESDYQGTAGNDAIDGNDQSNVISGSDGNDQLRGLGGDDLILGGRGNDPLEGGDGNDILVGGLGRDSLTGGSGADIFRFSSLGDFGDVITDFNGEEGDRLDLSDLIDQAEIATGTTITPANLDQFFRLEVDGNDRLLVADLDGAAGQFSEITLARLQEPTGADELLEVLANPPSDGATS